MAKKLKIRVTRKHIKAGIRGCATGCPVFLALSDAGLRVSAVGADGVYGTYPPFRGRVLPPAARRFVDAFDLGWPVKPFTFEVTL